ncbi:MAG: hypothetical protein WCK89_06400 [bacterium]
MPTIQTVTHPLLSVDETWCAIGNAALLDAPRKLALLVSRRCDGEAVLAAYDRVSAACDGEAVVVSGFHSPVEADCLKILLRSSESRVIMVLARHLGETFLVHASWREALEQGRMLILSAFPVQQKRSDRIACEKRNAQVISLCGQVRECADADV